MENFKMIPGGICAAGFSAAGVHCGIRHNHSKLDLALIKADVRCAGAGCYTTNKVYGAPITVDREHLKDGYAQAIVVNSGNANTCAPNGIELAKETCAIAAKELGISADDVLPASTGVIGQAMSIDPFANGHPAAAGQAGRHRGQPRRCHRHYDHRHRERGVHRIDHRRQNLPHGRHRQGLRHDPPQHGHHAGVQTTDAAVAREAAQKALSRREAPSTRSPWMATPPPTTPCCCWPPARPRRL